MASDLLGEPRLTLAAIARDIGYSSAFAFSTAFKKQFGVSPARYRQQKFGTGQAAWIRAASSPGENRGRWLVRGHLPRLGVSTGAARRSAVAPVPHQVKAP